MLFSYGPQIITGNPLTSCLTKDRTKINILLFPLSLGRELYSNNISGRIPNELGNLTNLVSLDLYLNSLSGPIPETLGRLQKLRFLYGFFFSEFSNYVLVYFLFHAKFCGHKCRIGLLEVLILYLLF